MSTRPALSPKRIGDLAVRALLEEARLSPKPGLVTARSMGAHADMAFDTLVRSAHALRPCFEACARAGAEAGLAQDTGRLFETLRWIGQRGEVAMFQATQGINTHKGALFCLGLLTASTAFLLAGREATESPGDAACHVAAGLCRGLVGRDLAAPPSHSPTAGARLYQAYGVRGARGEAEDAYPVLRAQVLPALRAAAGSGIAAVRRARIHALLASMATLEDSCLLWRGGFQGLRKVQGRAKAVIEAGGAATPGGRRLLQGMDQDLVREGLSPGGSADMLSAGIFLVHLEASLAATAERDPLSFGCAS